MKTIKKKIEVPSTLKYFRPGADPLPLLPTTVQHMIVEYSWYSNVNSKQDNKYLLSMSLVCKRWFKWVSKIFNENTNLSDEVLIKESNFLRHIANMRPEHSLIQSFNKMVAMRYVQLDTTEFKAEQLDKINKTLFGNLESLECEITSNQVAPQYFDPIVSGLKSQDRQLQSFIFRNTSINLTNTLKSLSCVTSQLKELSINTTHVVFKEYDLASYIKERANTLEQLTLSLFYDKVASVGFYEKALDCCYPHLKALQFGILDYTQQLDWSLINKTNYPKLTDVGFYWNSASRQLDTEYQEKFIACLAQFKRIHTTLNLSNLLINQLADNSSVEKWKLRIFCRYKKISFNPIVKTIAITFTQKFNQEGVDDETDPFMVSLFNSLAYTKLDYLSLWNIKTSYIPLLLEYLDSNAAKSISYFGFSIPMQTNISFNFGPLVEILATLPNLYTLEFTDISSPEHVEQIERITSLSSSVERLTFIHSSTLHEPTGMKDNDKYSVSYGGSTKTSNLPPEPAINTTKSSGFCKTQ